ncbi:hypothetical protein E2320_002730, partial [Naja naja]
DGPVPQQELKPWKAVGSITRQCYPAQPGCLGQSKCVKNRWRKLIHSRWRRKPPPPSGTVNQFPHQKLINNCSLGCVLFSPASACPVFSNLSSSNLSLCKRHVAMSPAWPRFLLTSKAFSTRLGFSVAGGAMLGKGDPKFPPSIRENLFST